MVGPAADRNRRLTIMGPTPSPPAYLTVATCVEAEVEVKRSRFLARLERVADEAQARAVVDQARRRHWDARHHCSAFRLGPEPATQRSSDDGEPAGTAGAPILDVLTGAGLSDCVVVVTRWFGGTLLGTGGLIRAYGDATRAVLRTATVLHRQTRQSLDVTVPTADAGRVEHALRASGHLVTSTIYGAADATITLAEAPDATAATIGEVAALTAGAAHCRPGPTTWVDVG